MKTATITVRCITCRAVKKLTAAEAERIRDVVLCEKCGMPMIVISAQTG